MTVSFLNNQSKFKVNRALRGLVKKCIKNALNYMEFGTKAEVSVMFCDNEGIRVLNKEHRHIDRETDVLSFPLLEFDRDGCVLNFDGDTNRRGEIPLGDIVISLEKAEAQAKEYGHSLYREVGFLTVHSVLHLLGLDHMTEDEEKVMFHHQSEILNEMGLKRD